VYQTAKTKSVAHNANLAWQRGLFTYCPAINYSSAYLTEIHLDDKQRRSVCISAVVTCLLLLAVATGSPGTEAILFDNGLMDVHGLGGGPKQFSTVAFRTTGQLKFWKTLMNTLRKPGFIIALITALFMLSSAPLRAQDARTGSAKDPLLETLNGEFRAQYRQALAEALAQAGPVILEEGDNLILLRHGTRTAVRVKPVEYHELKAVAHIPLALFVMLSFPYEANLSGEHFERLRHYRELMESAYESLPGRHFTADQLKRQQKIFRASFELLDGVLAKGQASPTALQSFTRQMGPLLLANVSDATAEEMRELYAAAEAWHKELTSAEWKALHVVMIGPRMPREQECSIQFFERLFREPQEGKRIIYAEALWDEKDALNLLATHVVDETAGAAFFGDPMRMHRDLLADAAKAYLDSHPLAP